MYEYVDVCIIKIYNTLFIIHFRFQYFRHVYTFDVTLVNNVSVNKYN